MPQSSKCSISFLFTDPEFFIFPMHFVCVCVYNEMLLLNWNTPQSRVLEKSVLKQLVKDFPALYGTGRFITYNSFGKLCNLGIHDQTYFFLVFIVDHILQISFSINKKHMKAAAFMHL